MDLREKIVETYKAGSITQRELAARFRVSLFFVIKLLGQMRRGEGLQVNPRGRNRKPLLNAEMRQFIEFELTRQNDLTLSELSERVAAEFAVWVSTATMCRALQTINYKRKKDCLCQRARKRKSPPITLSMARAKSVVSQSANLVFR